MSVRCCCSIVSGYTARTPTPILAASSLVANALILRPLTTTVPSAHAAINALQATNSQKSALSLAGIRPQDAQAGTRPVTGFPDLSSSVGVSGTLGEDADGVVEDVQCINCRFPNGWQNGSFNCAAFQRVSYMVESANRHTASSGHGSQRPYGVQTGCSVLRGCVDGVSPNGFGTVSRLSCARARAISTLLHDEIEVR